MNFERSRASNQWIRAFGQGARVIGDLDTGDQSASGDAIHGSLPMPGEKRASSTHGMPSLFNTYEFSNASTGRYMRPFVMKNTSS